MKALVAIANYGTKNARHAQRLIEAYQALPFPVDIHVLSEAPKDYGPGVAVQVGLPSPDPWSLPFAHRPLFAEKVDQYDLFIYTEDDVLIGAANIAAFLAASAALDPSLLPGFVRYEVAPDGSKRYPDAFGPHHWLPGSARQEAGYRYARFSNDHSACYLLTQAQLRRAIASGGFLVPPHQGRYDLICSAGNDPYVQCGFTRVVCFSHLAEFELHHLPNAYVGRAGLDEAEYQAQLGALGDILEGREPAAELLAAQKALPVVDWDKDYHEPCRADLLRRIPLGARRVLSVGCGWGATEAALVRQGRQVAAIPLDPVIGRLAARQGVRVLPSDLDLALAALGGERFDAVLLAEVLQHLPDPVAALARLAGVLGRDGVLVGSVPNLGPGRRLAGRLLGRRHLAVAGGGFGGTLLHATSAGLARAWLQAARLRPREARYEERTRPAPLSGLVAGQSWLWPALVQRLPASLGAARVVFVAERADAGGSV